MKRHGIDFDSTITDDPEYFRELIMLGISRGHSVVIVTARRPTPENKADVEAFLQEHNFPKINVFYTSLASKVAYMKKAGMPVDWWTDDDPLTCALGH